jgi:hypothetical protein
MCAQRTRATLLALVLLVSPASAFDLAKIDRRLDKEPRYQNQPQYCLLVFGPQAEHRVWLALDGEVLHADRNGNGDLTDNGEALRGADGPGGSRVFQAEVRTGPGAEVERVLLTVRVSERRKAPAHCFLTVAGEGTRKQYAGFDEGDPLHFANHPREAPVIHFGGCLTIRVRGDPRLARGGQPTELYAMIGTPGLGHGSFAALDYKGFPDGVSPVAEVAFPGRERGAKPITVKAALSERY